MIPTPTMLPHHNYTFINHNIKLASWNVDMNRFDVKESMPEKGFYSVKDIVKSIPRDSTNLLLHNVWSDNDAISIIKHLSSDYTYYYRPDSSYEHLPLCGATSRTLYMLDELKQCLEEKNIKTISYDNMLSCMNSMQKLAIVDSNCLSCILTNGDAMNVRFDDVYTTRYIIDKICTYNKLQNTTAKYTHNNNPGVLLLSKEELYRTNGRKISSNIVGRTNEVKYSFVKGYYKDGITQYLDTFMRQGVLLNYKCKDFKMGALSLPMDTMLRVPGKPSYSDIMNQVLFQYYDVLYGDFGIGKNNNHRAFDLIDKYGYIVSKKEFESDNTPDRTIGLGLKYGTYHPRGTTTQHNDRFPKYGIKSLYRQRALSHFVLNSDVEYNTTYYGEWLNTTSVHVLINIELNKNVYVGN